MTFDDQTNRLVNADSVTVRGAELSGEWLMTSEWLVRGNFTWQTIHVAGSDEPLRQRPGRRGGAELAWTPSENVSIDWRMQYTAHDFDSSVPTSDLMLTPYFRHDVGLTAQLSKRTRLTGAIDNVFNRRIEDYVGFPGGRRRLRTEIAVDF